MTKTRIWKPDDLIRVARRENNQKRSFLYVDPYQGKHIPVSPAEALSLFGALAGKVAETYPDEKLLIIGFAETATAIGNAIAYYLNDAAAFLTTTREDVEGASYLYFSESHSHATEQRLVLDGLAEQISRVDRIVFAEDEVTTGKTIAKAIRVLREQFPDRELHFGIASLLNSMSEENLNAFAEQGITCTYIARIPFGYRIGETEDYEYAQHITEPFRPAQIRIDRVEFRTDWEQRRAADAEIMTDTCDRFWQEMLPLGGDHKRILVLGTQEFMFPGLLLGAALENRGHTVRFHATTRSPIDVSEDPRYPLHRRFPLCSFYESDRRTFIYDLAQYDEVLLVTDAPEITQTGLDSLAGALEACGNTHITLIHWKRGNA
jgi:adenine/guanine phosphoribosyltransferase-like PRPP-binding protein